MPTPTTPPLLEARGLQKSFPGKALALDGVDFTAYAHEVHAVIGENGAGKSTLMHVLGGRIAADRGDIYLQGQRVAMRSPQVSQSHGIHLVSQDISVLSNLSVTENIYLGSAHTHGLWMHWAKLHEAAASLLESLGAQIDPRAPLHRLRTAEQQLVVIARALARAGSILVLDEPTSSLGEADSQRLLEVICGLKQEGMSVIYISHKLDEIYAVADRITVMHAGQVRGVLAGEAVSAKTVIGLMSATTSPAPKNVSRIDKNTAAMRLQVHGLARGTRVRPTSLHVRRGEVLGLFGLVGSGRSSLVRLLTGADTSDAGTIELDGVVQHFRTPADALRAGIAYVPEDHHGGGLFAQMTLQENVTLGVLPQCSAHGLWLDADTLQQRYAHATQSLGLDIDPHMVLPEGVSGGLRQKLLLARSLASLPKLLVLDEPTKGLDANTKVQLDDAITALSLQDTSILWVSCDATELLQRCDRILIMYEGELVGTVERKHTADFNEATLLAYATGIRNSERSKLVL